MDLLQKRKLGTTKQFFVEGRDGLKDVSWSLINSYLDAVMRMLDVKLWITKIRSLSTFGGSINLWN